MIIERVQQAVVTIFTTNDKSIFKVAVVTLTKQIKNQTETTKKQQRAEFALTDLGLEW